MLELKPGLHVGDLGSGCGLTGNTMAVFGCKVTGYEPGAKSVAIANKYAKKIGCQADVNYHKGYTNDYLKDQ